MLRNKELRRLAAAFGLITALAAAVGFSLQPAAGALALGTSAALGAVVFGFTHARYDRIARLSEQIDLVLHDADRLFIGESEEGELAVLESEIAKMTLRIREQNDALRADKRQLADSLADVAHQLRTPLTSVGILLTLLEGCDAPQERKKLLREAKALFDRMDWLLTALLKLSRLDAGVVDFRREPVAVDSLLDTALAPLAIPFDLNGITLRRTPSGAVLQGDAPWLAEALQNILKNCMESAGPGGTVEIAVDDTPLFTEITIRDNGRGFDPADLPHLFDRFYRGKDSASAGYGIGLALCRSIIARQGGSVTAGNAPQGGALFAVRFPK